MLRSRLCTGRHSTFVVIVSKITTPYLKGRLSKVADIKYKIYFRAIRTFFCFEFVSKIFLASLEMALLFKSLDKTGGQIELPLTSV